MRLLTFILVVVLNYSCNEINPNQQKYSKIKTGKTVSSKSVKQIQVSSLSIDLINKIFIESVDESHSFLENKINDRVKKSYRRIEPFSLSKSHEIVRMIQDGNEVWIDLIMYSYENKKYKEALQIIENDPMKGEIIFDKNWDRIIGIGSKLIRVNSGCTLSEQNWNRIINRFEVKIKESYKINWDGYKCKCGGPCKKGNL